MNSIQEIERLAKMALKHRPPTIRAHVLLAAAAMLRGQDKAARQHLKRGQKLGFDPLGVLVGAAAALRAGQPQVALDDLDKVLVSYPGFLHARATLGHIYVNYGRFREARATFTAMAGRVPLNPWVLAQRGYTEARLGRKTEAVTQTRAAVDLSPDSAYLWMELAGRQLDAQAPQDARHSLEVALRLDPDAMVALVRLGYVHLLLGDIDACIKMSQRALTQMEQTPRARERRAAAYAHVNLGRAYGRQGDLDRAFEHLSLARGTADVPWEEVENDPALTALRQDPRWTDLMEVF